MRKITTAIFPVGGLGTRFLPATKAMPKEMLPIANKPVVQYAFEEARDVGIEKFIFITGRNKNIIINHFDHSYELEENLHKKNKISDLESVIGWMPKAGSISFIRQQGTYGLGHAIWCARNFIDSNEAFVVILPDEMMLPAKAESESALNKMINYYYEKNENVSIVAVDEIDINESYKYGIVTHNEHCVITDMVEKPHPSVAPSNLAITGRYILQPELFQFLDDAKIGAGGEIQLTDAMKIMCREFPYYYNKITQARFDCGNVLGYLEANIAFALQDQTISHKVLEIIKKYSN